MALTREQLDLPWLRKALYGYIPQSVPTRQSAGDMVQNLQGHQKPCPRAVLHMLSGMENMRVPSYPTWLQWQHGNTGDSLYGELTSPQREAMCNHP